MSRQTATILITGGTTGLGFQAALAIAKQHPEYTVIVASRKDTDGAAASINRQTGNGNTVFLPLDLSKLSNVRTFVDNYATKDFSPIKALLLNAALQYPGEIEFSDDGIEKTLAITHVGHALLFYLLRRRLAEDARIIITTSGTHDPAQKTGMPDAEYVSAESVAHPDPAKTTKDGRQRYTTAKLCNVLWGYALHRRLTDESKAGKRWTVNSFDPGLMPGTGLARNYTTIFRFMWNHVLPYILPLLRLLVDPNIHTPQESGANLARLAAGQDLSQVSGLYFEGAKDRKSGVVSYESGKQDDLYEWTVKAIARGKEEEERFRNVYNMS